MPPGRAEVFQLDSGDEASGSSISAREPLKGLSARRSPTPVRPNAGTAGFDPLSRSRRPDGYDTPGALDEARGILKGAGRSDRRDRPRAVSPRPARARAREQASSRSSESSSEAGRARPRRSERQSDVALLAAEFRKLRVAGGGESGGVGEYGIKGYITYTKAKRRFDQHPAESLDHVHEQVRESLGRGRKLEEYLASYSHTQECKYSICFTKITSETIAALEENDVARAKGLQAKLLAFVDQVGINGNLELAWRLTMVSDPPIFLKLRDNFPRMPAAKGTHSGTKSRIARTPLVPRDIFNASLAEMTADNRTNDLLGKIEVTGKGGAKGQET